jgi:hypothetical protein
MLLAPSAAPVGISGDVHEVPEKFDEVTENPPAAPEVLEIMASLEPLASLTTVALTPRFAVLMAVARSFKLSPPVTPVPVGKVAVAPAVVVIVIEEVGNAEVGLVSRSEYHEPVVATLLTTTVCIPGAVPVAADAVRSLLFDEVTVRAARGPERVFSDCMSVARASVAVCIAVKAVVWLVNVAISAFHCVSGARSAAMPAATAAVTSMPGVVAPATEARILLISMAEFVVVEDRSELIEDVELIAST